MKPVKLSFVSQEDIIALGFCMQDAIDIVTQVLIEHAHKRYENPPKPGVHPQSDAFIHAMPAYLPRLGIAGLKWISGYSSNALHGLPNIMGLIILNDVATGRPLAVMEGGLITAMRTAAVSAVAAAHLAKPGAATLGIIGAGVQGRYHLTALKTVLPQIRRVQVFDISQPALDAYVEHFREMPGTAIEIAVSNEAVIRNSDIVVTATGNLDRIVYRDAWIAPGSLVLPVHMFGWERDAITQADQFWVDDWHQFHTYMQTNGKHYLPLPRPNGELGAIVAQTRQGRTHAQERIINFNLGLALHDIAIADHLFSKAASAGLGKQVAMVNGTPPFAG